MLERRVEREGGALQGTNNVRSHLEAVKAGSLEALRNLRI